MPTPEACCYVHIGAPKTGSTFLQRVFSDNREAMLEACGLLYPDVSLRGFGHHDLAFLLAGGYPDWATGQARPPEALTADLADAVAGHAGSVLLSSENFYLFPEPTRLKDLLMKTGTLRDRKARILVYLRPQDEAHESWYNQRVKAQGENGAIEESLSRFDGLWDYDAQLGAWEAAFGQDALVVRPWLPSGDPSWLLADALGALGMAGFRPALSAERVNTGYNADILEFQRIMNGLPLSPRSKRRFHQTLMALSEKSRGTSLFDERPLLRPDRRAKIMARYAAGNAAVARRYFGGAPLFPDPPVAHPTASSAASAAEPGLTPDKRLAIVAGLLLEGGEMRDHVDGS